MNNELGEFLVWVSAIASFAVATGLLARVMLRRSYIKHRLDAVDIRHNLPARRGDFVGREEELEQTQKALKARYPVVVIEGVGGIGKTALALQAAYELLKSGVFSSAIWTTRDATPPHLADILNIIAEVLDVPGIVPLQVEKKEPQVLGLLQDMQCLLVVDGFEEFEYDPALIHFLERVPEPSKVLITTRHSVPLDIDIIYTLSLAGMMREDILHLIRIEAERLGLTSIAKALDDTLAPLYLASGGVPLTIKWALGKMAQTGESFDTTVKRLNEADDQLFDSLLGESWETVGGPGQAILMAMAAFPAPVSSPLIQLVTGLDPEALAGSIEQLLRVNLIEIEDPLDQVPRFCLHAITRSYAMRRLKKDASFSEEVYDRATEYYREFVTKYGGVWWKIWKEPRDQSELKKELENIRHIMNWCYSNKRGRDYIELVSGINSYLGKQGYLQERIRIGVQATRLARALDDTAALAWLMGVVIPWAHYYCGKFSRVRWYASKGVRLAEETGNLYVESYAHHLLSLAALGQNEATKATELAEKGLQVARESGESVFVGVAIADRGYVALSRGDFEEAEKQLLHACEVLEEAGEEERLSGRLIALGDALRGQGRTAEALSTYRRGLALAEGTPRIDSQARGYFQTATLLTELGDYKAALEMAISAAEVYKQLGQSGGKERALSLADRLEALISN